MKNKRIIAMCRESFVGPFKQNGFEVFWTECTPFDAVTRETETEAEMIQKLIIAGVGHKSEKNIKKRVQITRDIAELTRKIAMFVLEGSSIKNIEGVPIIRDKELSRFETAKELEKAIKKRMGSSNYLSPRTSKN
jgi:predicted transcriptional regulator